MAPNILLGAGGLPDSTLLFWSSSRRMYSDMARYRSSYRLSCNRSVGRRTDFRNGKIGIRIILVLVDDLFADDGVSSTMLSNEENRATPNKAFRSKISLLGWVFVAVGSPRGSVIAVGTTNAKEEDHKILQTSMAKAKQYARILVATSY